MSEVQIVLLNGPTCSGKTTIAGLIQKQSERPYVLMPIDAFVAMLPSRYREPPCPDNRPIVIAKLRHGFHAAVASMAGQGNYVIVDTVRAEPGWLDEWLEVFKPFSVLFVGVFARLEELERRECERQRPDDLPGTAKRHFYTVHEDDVYDIRLDTSALSPEECAERVLGFLRSKRMPTAFNELRKRGRK